MKPCDIRKFHDWAFIHDDVHLNGKVFLVLPWRTDANISILVEGKLESSWSYNVLVKSSEELDETG